MKIVIKFKYYKLTNTLFRKLRTVEQEIFFVILGLQ